MNPQQSVMSEVSRRLEHPDGRWTEFYVADCRVYTSWGSSSQPGKRHTATKLDDADAVAHARTKLRKAKRDRFVDVGSCDGPSYDRAANVVEVMRSSESPMCGSRFDYQPVGGHPNVYQFHAVNMVDEWLVCSDDLTRAVLTRVSLRTTQLEASDRNALSQALLDQLVSRRDDILADESTPLRKLTLGSTIGPFTHLVVISPTSYDFGFYPELGRSIWFAFPSYNCETTGAESVAEAECRTRGRGSIPHGKWDREPHPVFDLRVVKRLDREARGRFLLNDPAQLERQLSSRALSRLKGEALDVKNFAGQTRRLLRGSEPDAAELADIRAFLGIPG